MFSQITIKDLTLAYGEKVVLDTISLRITQGQLTAIAGVSGQGKTSLAQLLLKRQQATSGYILFDDVDSKEVSMDSLNQQLLYVSDQSTLLNRSIYDNLTLAANLSKKEVLEWIDQHGLLTFINWLPDGLDTLVGENGNLLSPGQRQQVICARALLSQRSLYIFDEATSSLDAENERIIDGLIEQLAKKAIVIVITHKMSRLKRADQVLF